MSREMKYSGIPWIGEIPKDWSINLLSSLFDEHKQKNKDLSETNLLSLSYGKIIRKDINTKEGLLPESFDGYNIISDGDIVFRLTDLQNDKRSLRTGLCFEKGIITSAYVTIRARQELHSPYYHYLVHSYDVCKVFYGMGDGVRQGMNYSDLRKLFLISPSFSEQQKIVEVLDKKCGEVDEMIALQEQIIEELKAYKQSVITEAVTKGLNPNVPMKDSGIEWIGEIPDHWKICKNRYLFKENVRQCNGTEISLSLSQADGLVPTSEMKESAMKSSSYENWKAVKVNDIVLNRFKAHLGVLFRAKLEGMVSFHYGVYEAITKLYPQYFEYLYHSDNYKYVYSIMSNGMVVGLQNLSNTNFYRVDCIVPPLTEQQLIADYLDKKCGEIDALIAIKQQKIDSLKEYKKSIIYEYVTGKKEVV